MPVSNPSGTSSAATVRQWVVKSTSYTMSENDRGVLMDQPGVVDMPSQTDFQQSKTYSVINGTNGGSVTVHAATGETVNVGSASAQTYTMDPSIKSVDLTRIGGAWWAQ